MIQEHLVWLDREIAAETGAPPSPPVRAPALTDPAQTEAIAEQIFSQYRGEAQSLRSNVKRGCLLYFILAFALVGLGVLALYLHTVHKQ